MVQAFTRDILHIPCLVDYYKQVDDIMAKAKSVAKKVVIPSVVHREDVADLWKTVSYTHLTLPTKRIV